MHATSVVRPRIVEEENNLSWWGRVNSMIFGAQFWYSQPLNDIQVYVHAVSLEISQLLEADKFFCITMQHLSCHEEPTENQKLGEHVSCWIIILKKQLNVNITWTALKSCALESSIWCRQPSGSGLWGTVEIQLTVSTCFKNLRVHETIT